MPVNPQEYNTWYDSPRGRWIGSVEYVLLKTMLQPEPGSSLLDIGCGTGYFTRRFARVIKSTVMGIDSNEDWVWYARTRSECGERYVTGRAETLPFADHSFDFAVSVTALGFVRDQVQALRELVRVTRRRFALELLNRHSLLYIQKGLKGGTGGYQGTLWHTSQGIRALLTMLPVDNLILQTAILVPRAGAFARVIETCWPKWLLCEMMVMRGFPCLKSR